MSDIFDGIRLDHFRGFESYWAIPAQSRNPLDGHFEPGPGKDLFIVAKKYLKNKIIVGEDLGVTTPQVQDLINSCDFYNMRVFQFGLGVDAQDNLPDFYTSKCIAYTGTHDTNTLRGYIDSLTPFDKNKLKKAITISKKGLYDSIMKAMCESDARIVFFPIQDLLKLDKDFVLNTHTPSIENWGFRINDSASLKNYNLRRN